MASTPPLIFTDKARHAKRRRGRAGSHRAEFIHNAAAEEIVDRLETVLRPFEKAVFYGAAAVPAAKTLTPAADVGECLLADEIEGPGIDLVCPPDELPFSDRGLDLFVSAVSLHAVNDVAAALAEARRVLKPDGLFLAIFPGGETLRELRASLADAETEIRGGLSPRVHPNIAVRDGGALLQHAGFALPVADIRPLNVSYETPLGLISDLRAMGETNALADAARGALRRDVVARMAARYQERFSDEEGRIRARFDLITLTGWVPAAGQPQPLEPGSATISLADVFKKAR
ncbi:MAG: methyltransferase domain-containing protein [Parvularcula sp.]